MIEVFILTTDFWPINWYYIVAPLLTIIGLIIAYRNYKKRSSNNQTPVEINNNQSYSPNNSNSNSLILNFNNSNPLETITPPNEQSQENDNLDKLKKNICILFIDDDTKFKIVKMLINEGWINTKNITDLKSYNDENIRNSHIVFVDVQGVGKALDCKDEGLGLALNIKNMYPQKKVVIYSAIQTHKVFHESIQKVDFLLPKDAEPYEFMNLIERFSKEIDP